MLTEGARLGSYRVVAPLGAGGMGHVYRARDARLGRDVAVKVVNEHLTRDPSVVDRFVREARAASRLNHPNIVTIHEIGEAEGGRFIVMELVEGRTLRAMAADRVPWESVVDVGRQIAKALAAAHAAGIVHRDVKPENVMVRDDGLVKVLDFGLARLLPNHGEAADTATASGTEAGVVLGTLRYMAPEQARGEAVERAADVFALGLVLYELATGRHPFGADTSLGIVGAIASDAALPPSRLNTEIPAALDAVLLQMLDKDPRRRPTAADMDALLAHMSAAVPVTRAGRDPRAVPRTSVGRERELAALHAAFDSAAAGNGLLVCVAGEPGIGKTTLVEDFLADIETKSLARVARGRCSERLAGTEAYLPWLEALENAVRGASGAEMTRLMRLVAPSWYAQVAPSDADHEDTTVGPRAASQERIKREATAFLQEATRVRPLVLFVDDVHWSDVSTVDLLAYVGTRLASMRLLIVVTYRPSELAMGQHPFGPVKLDLQSRRVCREVLLEFLSREDVGHYLDLEFPGHHFPAEFGHFIHAKTEGSPLFIGGLLRDLRDRQVIAEDRGSWSLVRAIPVIGRELPESVRSMIQRTVEKLQEPDRELLLGASVQGYEFDSAVVAEALVRDAALVEERLDRLERVHALIRGAGDRDLPDRTPSVRYRFVHVLYQNVLYGSLAPTRKAALSAAVANALAAHFGDARTEIAAELALLFETARDPERAVEYLLLAAQRAARMFAHQEAIVLSRRALDLLETLAETPQRDRRELDLLMTLGPALSLTEGFFATSVEKIFARAQELCERVQDTAQLFPALFGLCMYYGTRVSPRLRDLSGQLDALAERAQDPLLRLQAHHAIWTTLVAEGELVNARARLEEGIALYDPARHAPKAHSYAGHDPGVCAMAFSGLALWALGYPDRALARAHDAVALARTLALPFSIGQSLFYASMLHQLRGETLAARDHAADTIAVTREQVFPQFLSYGNVVHGWALVALGEQDEGLKELREGLEAAKAMGDRYLRPHWLALLADAQLHAGRADEGLAAVNEGLSEVRRAGRSFAASELYRLAGELHRLRLEHDEAEACFQEALAVARRQSARAFELRAALSLARLWHGRDREVEGRRLLEACNDWFTEGLDSMDLREARARLAGASEGPLPDQ